MAPALTIDPPAVLPSGDLQTFVDEADRAHLTRFAGKAFVRLAGQSDLSNSDAAALLGVSASTWDRIKAGRWDGVLCQDQLTRVPALVGTYKDLHLLFADGMADRWPRLPNRNPLFERLSPIAAMVEGGIPRMLETRQYIDALRGGL